MLNNSTSKSQVHAKNAKTNRKGRKNLRSLREILIDKPTKSLPRWTGENFYTKLLQKESELWLYPF